MKFIFFMHGSAKRLFSVSFIFALLAGCATGGYQDPVGSDVAKIRLISDLSNSTFNYFDAQNCSGKTTGLLNNWMAVDTKRRVDMTVPPPKNAKNYIEIGLRAGHEVMLQANTMSNSGGSVCGIGFALVPQAHAEYEAVFTMIENYCALTVSQLQSFNGKVERVRLPVNRSGLAECAGKSIFFPEKPAND